MIPLKAQSGQPLYEQIYEYMKDEIRKGGLASGSRLPSTRVLAEHLKVSRSTTQMAYEQLMAEGYIETIPCKGCFVLNIEELTEEGLWWNQSRKRLWWKWIFLLVELI